MASRLRTTSLWERFRMRGHILDPHQSGFTSLHSTVTAHLDLTNQWCFNIDRGLITGVLFLDLKIRSITISC